jgi:taurine--2-oxoglutarate transaminase
VRALCDRYGIIYIADEVMSGFGRTGAWFAYQQHGVTPDLVTFAKGVNSGYVPLGGVVIGPVIADAFADRVYPGGLTYSGHPLACASAVAAITAMEEEGVVENARRIGEEILGPGLRALADRHMVIGEVRGVGVFWALELVSNRATKEPLAPYGASSPAMNELVAACRREGLLIFNNFNRIHVVPPCTITAEEATEGLRRLDAALSSISHAYSG